MTNEKGFTLVEILAAMTILVIVLISFFTMFSQSALFTRSNEETLRATNLANRAMDIMRADGSLERENQLTALINAALIEEGTCQPAELFSEIGCRSDEMLSLRVHLIEANATLGMMPVRIEVFHRERAQEINTLATRHFYLSQ